MLNSIFTYFLFKPIYLSSQIYIPYSINPINICIQNPNLWIFIKNSFIFFFIFSNIVIYNSIYLRIFKLIINLKTYFSLNKNISKSTNFQNSDTFYLKVGNSSKSSKFIYIPEKGMYQNFLITGTIGSGKTSSAMYPFTNQLLKYNSISNNLKKFAILILDVKGNYRNYVFDLCSKYGLENDIIEISLHSGVKYNPLDKPLLKPTVIANTLKTVLSLFSEKNSESFWLDKAEQIIAECIKLCRLYNNHYVSFVELHKLIFFPNYYKEKINILKNLFISR